VLAMVDRLFAQPQTAGKGNVNSSGVTYTNLVDCGESVTLVTPRPDQLQGDCFIEEIAARLYFVISARASTVAALADIDS
jgi:hypothetical protein